MPSPKYFSKNTLNFSIMPCFFFDRFPPPKRETGGISLSISVPVVLIAPSRKAFSINSLVSMGLRFSPETIAVKSASSCSDTYRRQSLWTELSTLTRLINCSINSFLLRSWILASTALRIVDNISLSSQFPSWYFSTSIRI